MTGAFLFQPETTSEDGLDAEHLEIIGGCGSGPNPFRAISAGQVELFAVTGNGRHCREDAARLAQSKERRARSGNPLVGGCGLGAGWSVIATSCSGCG
jgi:hypothetical protein